MNTKFKLNRQVVLTLCVLLTAMWLPLTTFAQDLPKISDPARKANTHADKCVRCQSTHGSMDFRDCQHLSHSLAFLPVYSDGADDSGVGFAETDPTIQDSLGIPTTSRPTGVQIQQTFVGFAETDPTDQSTVYGSAITKTPADRVQLASVGFAETDPAEYTYRSSVEIQNQHLVVCPHEHVKSVVYTEPGFHGLVVN